MESFRKEIITALSQEKIQVYPSIEDAEKAIMLRRKQQADQIISLFLERVGKAKDSTNTRRCFTKKEELHAFDTGYFVALQAAKAVVEE